MKMKKAFTMIELVFVIVVIGILAATIIPRTKSNSVQDAAIDLQSKIQYTQHLAIVDDVYGTGATWYKNRWQIRFNGNKYSIVSNNNGTFATDPLNRDSRISNIDLNAKYGVTVEVNGTECGIATSSGEHIISFDYLGRPLAGDLNISTGAYLGIHLIKTNDCTIILTNGTESATLKITPETGYVYQLKK